MNELSMFEKTIYNTYLKTSRNKKGFTPRKDFKNLDDEKYVLLKKISQTLKNKKITIGNEKFLNKSMHKKHTILLKEIIKFEKNGRKERKISPRGGRAAGGLLLPP